MPDPIFTYSAVNGAGQTVHGKIFAPNASQAEQQLRDKGLISVVVRLTYLPKSKPKGGSKSPTQRINIDSPKVNHVDNFYLKCPTCMSTLRLSYPLLERRWTCPECKLKFSIEPDLTGELTVQLHLAANESETHREWHQVLNLTPDSPLSEIRKSYRRLIQKYHPDKVADLGTELVQLAEQKTKEINSAYERALTAVGAA
jgi:hypothetical protein